MLIRNKNDYSTNPYTVFKETVHVGRSVFCKPETVQVMSDVWEEHMCLTSINLDGSLTVDYVARCGMHDDGALEYVIDATPQALADYALYEYNRNFKCRLDEAEIEANNPAIKGRVVQVMRGRTGKGLVGRVVAVILGNYDMGWRSTQMCKLGIALSPEKVTVIKNGKTFENYKNMIWVWAKNCRVETPEPVNTAVIKELARDFAMKRLTALDIEARANERYSNQNRKVA